MLSESLFFLEILYTVQKCADKDHVERKPDIATLWLSSTANYSAMFSLEAPSCIVYALYEGYLACRMKSILIPERFGLDSLKKEDVARPSYASLRPKAGNFYAQ